jgi:uncharacterized protein (TIGR04255 family)
MRKVYENPPVTEALCEFRFPSPQPWDWTVAGLLYGKIAEEFPIREQGNVVTASFDPAGNPIGQQVQTSVRFMSPERTEVVQLAPALLSIHQLKPYRSWDHFRSRILRILGIFRGEIEVESLNRIALRYIDRVELPPGRQELNDYFRVMPHVPDPIPQVFQSFLTQLLIPYGENLEGGPPESWLRLAFASVDPTTPNQFAVVLDVEVFSEDKTVPEIDGVADWIEVAHSRLEDAFEAAFTDKTRKDIFKEVQS